MNRFLNTGVAAWRARATSISAALLAVLVVAGSAGVRPANAQIGGAAVVFLMIEPDSRSAGMGNTGVAVADNAYSIFWNPAGLAYQEGIEASLTHSNWLPEFDAGLYYEYLVGKYHVPGWGTFGAHVTFLNLGEHEGRDAQNNPTGTFRSYDLAVGGSYGFKVSERFALGTSIRFIYSNLAPGQSTGLQQTRAGVSTGIDIGGLYRTAPFALGNVQTTFSAGFNLANMGPTIQYSDSDQADPIPTNMRFGYAVDFEFDEHNRITVANDFVKMLTHSEFDEETETYKPDPFYKAIFSAWAPIEVRTNPTSEDEVETTTVGVLEQLIIGTGAEYWYNDLFALRLGYFYENPYNGNRQFLTFGAGIRYSLVGVDFSYIYALEENHPLSDTMRFSLLLNFGQ
ncbi:MAG TPA: type IX secretion system outer membrane channel protein PorV [Rhodothermales bacterium]